MDQFTLVSTSAGEQNLTPGEQRILVLLGQVQQRMDSMEKKLDSHGQQLDALTIKVDHESGASKMRDRQLAIDLQNVREDMQHRETQLKAHIDHQVNNLRKDLGERFDQVDTRLGIVEEVVQLNSKQIHDNTQGLQALQQEVRKRSGA
jgi:hypothetical protein